MYALGIVDLLDDHDVAGRRIVAGTGEITIDGEVRPVGGVRQKLAGAREQHADLFLVPADELAEACADADGLDVYAVGDLGEAVKVLTDPAYAAARACP
jgi:PDZ domain-containing protein